MINRILVPLDGSFLAESVLPVAAYLARKINVSITFIHIIEKDAPEKIHGQKHLTAAAQAMDYLQKIADLDIFRGINVEIHVHESSVKDVSRSIADHSEELSQDLVLMCTHGSSGIHDLLFGSIAQQVIAHGNTPVLLINPENKSINEKFNFENMIVPLDGNPEHEQALEYASWLAKLCDARLKLLMAIPHFGNLSGEWTSANRFLPGTTTRMMDMFVSDAKEYLDKLQSDLEKSGLEVTTCACRMEPANAIIEMADAISADLIIIGTHGKAGTEAFWAGSITPKISRLSKVPLLLIPVKK